MAGMYPDNQTLKVDGEELQFPGLGKDGKFTNGDLNDPTVQPSFIPAETVNLLLDNTGSFIETLGGTPNNKDGDQLAKSFAKYMAEATRKRESAEDTLQEKIDSLKAVIPLQASNTNQLADKQYILDKIAEIVAEAPAAFDSLKEISDWIESHTDSAAAMNSAIKENASNIAGLLEAVKNLVLAELDAPVAVCDSPADFTEKEITLEGNVSLSRRIHLNVLFKNGHTRIADKFREIDQSVDVYNSGETYYTRKKAYREIDRNTETCDANKKYFIKTGVLYNQVDKKSEKFDNTKTYYTRSEVYDEIDAAANFDPATEYYIKNGNTYSNAGITDFEDGIKYYVKRDVYTKVSISSFASTVEYYTIEDDYQSVDIKEFETAKIVEVDTAAETIDPSATYYVFDAGGYVSVNITAFENGIKYYKRIEPPKYYLRDWYSYEVILLSSFNKDKVYYIADNKVISGCPTISVNGGKPYPIKVEGQLAGENFVNAGATHELVFMGDYWEDKTAILIYRGENERGHYSKYRGGKIEQQLPNTNHLSGKYEYILTIPFSTLTYDVPFICTAANNNAHVKFEKDYRKFILDIYSIAGRVYLATGY